MKVTLLGTGDTTGTPTPNCECATCEAARERGVERTRFSVHVENESTNESLLLDFSPDFRRQFLREDVPLPDAGVVTHVHFDHVDGLGNANRLLDDLPVYAADETDPATGESVAETVARKFDYLDALDTRAVAPHETFEAAGFDVTLVPVDHPPMACYGVVVESDGVSRSKATGGSGRERSERPGVSDERSESEARRGAKSFETAKPFRDDERREASFEPRNDGVSLNGVKRGSSDEQRESDGAKLVLSGDTTYDVPEDSCAAMRDADLLLADGIVPASLCEYHPKGGQHKGPDGTFRTFGTKHMTREGALALGDDLDADETRVVHAAHFYPEEEAFADEIAVDGETFRL